MTCLKLTDTERLLLANQYEILGRLKNDEQYELMAQTLRDGHEWLYRQYFDVLSENLPDEKVEHVLAILGIYGDMRDSFKELTDKTGLEESKLTFPGFDGNNECELLSFTEALRKSRRFENTIGVTAKNSHMPTTDMYQRMIDEWKALGSPSYPYSREQIVAIIASRIHPSNRK
ncbi:MAG: YfbU family protein [Gallionella sp.]